MNKIQESPAERFARMNCREEALWQQGYKYVAGVDEVGRGPLAGPVCVAACILDPQQSILGLDDSKKLTAKKRLLLVDEIKRKALAYAVKLVTPHYIDTYGINAAIRLACNEALHALEPQADYALFDYVSWELPMRGEKVVKGDATCNCIAAASILAKVTRDRYMQEQALLYPEYGFDSNAGYGSKAHVEAIRQFGATKIHRISFLQKILLQPPEDKKL